MCISVCNHLLKEKVYNICIYKKHNMDENILYLCLGNYDLLGEAQCGVQPVGYWRAVRPCSAPFWYELRIPGVQLESNLSLVGSIK